MNKNILKNLLILNAIFLQFSFNTNLFCMEEQDPKKAEVGSVTRSSTDKAKSQFEAEIEMLRQFAQEAMDEQERAEMQVEEPLDLLAKRAHMDCIVQDEMKRIQREDGQEEAVEPEIDGAADFLEKLRTENDPRIFRRILDFGGINSEDFLFCYECLVCHARFQSVEECAQHVTNVHGVYEPEEFDGVVFRDDNDNEEEDDGVAFNHEEN